jgi:hypothetical protein
MPSGMSSGPPGGSIRRLGSWKTFASGGRTTTWTKKVGDKVYAIHNNAAHNAGTGYGLHVSVKGGSRSKVGDFDSPEAATKGAADYEASGPLPRIRFGPLRKASDEE